jgi:hypothetical protein
MAVKIGTLTSSAAGPTGPSGPSGPSGPPGPSGTPGTGGGGGGGGSIARRLGTSPQFTDFGPTTIFQPISIGAGETWRVETNLTYSCDDPNAEFYFAPNPFVGVNYTSLRGELFYTTGDTTWPVKRFPLLGGIIGTGAQDGGDTVALEGANVPYVATLSVIVTNTSNDPVDLNTTVQIIITGPTVTVYSNSMMIATPVTVS